MERPNEIENARQRRNEETDDEQTQHERQLELKDLPDRQYININDLSINVGVLRISTKGKSPCSFIKYDDQCARSLFDACKGLYKSIYAELGDARSAYEIFSPLKDTGTGFILNIITNPFEESANKSTVHFVSYCIDNAAQRVYVKCVYK